VIHVADTVTGTVVASYAYDSYGQLTQTQGTLTQPYAYTGREYDTLVINTYRHVGSFFLRFNWDFEGVYPISCLTPREEDPYAREPTRPKSQTPQIRGPYGRDGCDGCVGVFGTFHAVFRAGVRQGSPFHRSRGNDRL
jgi:hypothetical protein